MNNKTRTTLYAILAPVALGLILSRPASANDLVTNGSFEQPAIGPGFALLPTIPGWSLDPSSHSPFFEIQNNIFGPAADGDQYVELNSTGTTAIFEDLPTTAGTTYKLNLAYSPRPGVLDNTLNISWNGALVDTLTADGTNNTATAWTFHTYSVTATGNVTRLQFDDFGDPDNSVGTFVDAVSVTAVPEPGSVALLAGFLTLGGLALRHRKR